MVFGFTPVAEASVKTLVNKIDKVILNPIILFLFAAALAYFLYGVTQYLLNPDSKDIRKRSKSQMMSGIFGLFIMVAVFGIMNLILHTLGVKNINIHNNGNFEVATNGNDVSKSEFDVLGKAKNPTPEDITKGMIDVRSGNTDLTNVATTHPSNYNANPFKVRYIGNSLCWQKYIEAIAPTEYQSIKKVKEEALNIFHELPGGFSLKPNDILNFGTLTAYNPDNGGTYYTWMDARVPVKSEGGTANDCVLKVDTSKTTAPLLLSDILTTNNINSLNYFSKPAPGPNPFTTVYTSNSLFTRVTGSAANPALDLARDLAIKAAYKLMGEKVDVNNFTIIHANILDEKYEYDASTGNYNYWVAIEHRNGTDNDISSTTGANSDTTTSSVCCAYFDDSTGKTTYATVDKDQCKTSPNCTHDASTGLDLCTSGGGTQNVVDDSYCSSSATGTSGMGTAPATSTN